MIASKFAIGKTRNENYPRKGNGRKAMMTAVQGSLKRLKTDYIDLYWLHAHDAMTPIEEILRGYDDLIRSGTIRYGGLSNFPAWRVAYGAALAERLKLAPITAVSYEYSLAERSAEREVLPMAEALGIGVGFGLQWVADFWQEKTQKMACLRNRILRTGRDKEGLPQETSKFSRSFVR